MYGITIIDREILKDKLNNQKNYLDNNFLNVGGSSLPYSAFYFSSWHNPARYISELNNRVFSMSKYAKENDLKPIFAVFTLPSEYHRKKTITIKGVKKLVRNDKFIDDENHSVKAGSDKLQSVVRSIMNSTVFREIPKDKRCYITTKEPHKDGTCHLNFLCFVPKEYVERCVTAIKYRFLDNHSRVEININNATAYIMKYIFKTLDDLRDNPSLENLTDITYWYLKHKIRRVTMSKTFISLEIYRKLNGRIDLITLTKNYNKGLVTVLIDENNKPVKIFDEFGDLWNKTRFNVVINSSQNRYSRELYKQAFKQASKDGKFLSKQEKRFKYISENLEKENYIKHLSYSKRSIPSLTDYELLQYYQDFKKCYIMIEENPQRFSYLENELNKRGFGGLTTNKEIIKIDSIDSLLNDYSNAELLPLRF
ncbi:putative phage replication initiation protein [Campylobacter blaseri]|uniref:Radical SAM protein n=1 Tax=Campylobacter blaseri TaxID=2042961 RepID=A0A2P8R2K2_9BACT|nr:radical SAM protein [Campylobacter blaseri]PSM52721.1 radical SAM protein [Campylobacter blaseri]PSM54369.1 radical SAM protein [Campylobacter blaseri]QKF86025.1 putative phage replication initiation protein [Campylobacter blaseri]